MGIPELKRFESDAGECRDHCCRPVLYFERDSPGSSYASVSQTIHAVQSPGRNVPKAREMSMR